MQLARVERKYAHVPVTATLHDGSPAAPAAVEVALLEPYGRPAADTVWHPSTYADGDAVVLLAGPDAAADGALTLPADGADLWVRVTDNPEVTVARIARIIVA